VRDHTEGFVSGFDARFGAARLGIVGGYSHSGLNVDDRASSASLESGHLGAYAGTQWGPLNLRAGATWSFHSIDTSRTILFPGFFDTTKGHFNGSTGQVFGEAGYGLTWGGLALEPFAGLAWVHVATGSLVESGGVAALSVGRTNDDVGYSSLGTRVATILPLANGMALTPRAGVAWQHAFGDVNPTAALAFQSTGAAFTGAGVPVARDAAQVEAGLDLRVTSHAKFGVGYLGQLASSAQTHAVKGGFTWNF
jgi:outer membrane autotransporter protein